MITITIVMFLLIIVGMFLAIYFNKPPYGFIVCLSLTLIPFFGVAHLPYTNTIYYAPVKLETKVDTIYFTEWNQNDNCVSIDGYYTLKEWDWKVKYIYHPGTLTLRYDKLFKPDVYQKAKERYPVQVDKCQ